ncbi:MAG TPA: trypsin-like peptidase domain-containing protein, partial [Bryobacteraceae bacterium]|nr:trypsin-like peptidase domain-containing protein [Bryobacteraceae bacterium]
FISMKLRIVLITALLVGGFLAVTSRTNWGQRRIIEPISHAGGKFWSASNVARGAGRSADELNNIDIYKAAHLATVNITSTVYRRTIFLEIYPSKDQGSGFLISEDGKILTNNHVVANEHQLEVTLSDQSKYKANLLSRDEGNDLALLQITPRKKLPILRLGDSEGLQVGQKVLAIGNPFGLDGTLTTGVVSSLGRAIRGEDNQRLEGLIQTDAAINMGNSGGPLLDSSGDVIGINTAILGPNGGNIGIGFAMPINRAKLMLDDFQAGRKRPRLGVTVVPVSGDYADALNLPNQGGLLIQEVESGSAAAVAGLRGGRDTVTIGNAQLVVGGDLIMSIDGHPIDREDAISRALAHKRAGDTIELTIFRGGRTMNVRVRLGEAGGRM